MFRDLYIRALRAMYDANFQNDASFFQVAGIKPLCPLKEQTLRPHQLYMESHT